MTKVTVGICLALRLPIVISDVTLILGIMEGKTLLHYQILRELGKGSMGVVYLAKDTRLKRRVALKVLSQDLRENQDSLRRFQIEAEAAAKLNHPNIATIYAVEKVNGQYFIAMEYLEGESLKGLIPKDGLQLDVFLEWFIPLSEALAHAREKGIIHRDIKPGNIMITRENCPKILDFGLARIHRRDTQDADASAPDAGMTQIGTIMGSPAYMSPEQATGKRVDQRTDIFSFGVVMYEALTGKKPFKGQTIQELITSLLKDDPQAVTVTKPGLPYLLGYVITKALQKDLRKRYQTALDLLNDLGAVKRDVDANVMLVDNRTATGTEKAAKAKSTRKWPVQLLSSVIFLALGVAAGWFLSGRSPAPIEKTLRIFEIQTEGVLTPATDRGASISPNGKMIAYVENSRLFVRDLDKKERREIPNTQGAAGQPFWSADSEFVGYFSDLGRAINKVRALGGPSTVVCDISGRGFTKAATWGSDGKIVFDVWGGDLTSGRDLYKVDARGGEPEPLLLSEPANGEYYQTPQFLPHGKGLLFAIVHPDSSCELVVKSGDSRKTIVQHRGERIAFPVYCTSGHILYQRGWINNISVWAVPFSLSKLKATGEPFQIAQDSGWPSVSSDGTLVYISDPQVSEQLVWLDRSGQVLGTIGPPLPGTEIGGVSLSADGSKVAIDAFDKTFEDIWIIDVMHGTKKRLTYDNARDGEPTWAPGGDRIAYVSDLNGLSDIFVKTLDPRVNSKPLVGGVADKFSPDWSKDGKYLAFHMRAVETKHDIWYLAMDAAAKNKPTGAHAEFVPFLQSPFEDALPQLSPDSRFVAYMSNVSGPWEIYLRPFPSGTVEWQVSLNGGMYPRWNGKGDELFYVEGDTLMAAKVGAGSRPKIGIPKKLFEWKQLGLSIINRYDVSSDGQRFVGVTNIGEGAASILIVEHWTET